MQKHRVFVAQPLVNVEMPEIPMLKLNNILKVGQKLNFIAAQFNVSGISQFGIHCRPNAAGMSNDIVHFIVVAFEVRQALVKFVESGYFRLPPTFIFHPLVSVCTHRTAESENCLALKFINLTSH